MPLYSGPRDISLFRHLNKELLHRIIDTVIGYYKVDIEKTNINIYGESLSKIFKDPVLIHCYIDRGEPQQNDNVNLRDRTRTDDFRFLRDDLVDANLVPEIGDIIMYNENYYEVDLVIENQYFMNKNPDYSYQQFTDDYGWSTSIILKTHQTKPEIPGITIQQL